MPQECAYILAGRGGVNLNERVREFQGRNLAAMNVDDRLMTVG
jgi:hypothetical protein